MHLPDPTSMDSKRTQQVGSTSVERQSPAWHRVRPAPKLLGARRHLAAIMHALGSIRIRTLALSVEGPRRFIMDRTQSGAATARSFLPEDTKLASIFTSTFPMR